jgi:hypothetical protein
VNADGLPDIFTLMEQNGYTKVLMLMNGGNLHFSKVKELMLSALPSVAALIAVDKVGHWLISPVNLVLHISRPLAPTFLASEHPYCALLESLNDSHRLVVTSCTEH